MTAAAPAKRFRDLGSKAVPYLLIAPVVIYYIFFWIRPVLITVYEKFPKLRQEHLHSRTNDGGHRSQLHACPPKHCNYCCLFSHTGISWRVIPGLVDQPEIRRFHYISSLWPWSPWPCLPLQSVRCG